MRTYACAYPCKYSSSIKTFTPMLMPTPHRSRQVKKSPQVHANSKGSYQSAHPRSPMRGFAIRTEYALIPRNHQTDNSDSRKTVRIYGFIDGRYRNGCFTNIHAHAHADERINVHILRKCVLAYVCMYMQTHAYKHKKKKSCAHTHVHIHANIHHP